jgi:methionine-rich copper-binding protein CopC
VEAEPAANATITASPSVIRLFFTEEPQVKVTTVRLLDASEKERPLEVPYAETDTKVVAATLKGPIQPGAYKVVWRAMAKDGHVVSGNFTFTLMAAAADLDQG